MGASMNRLIKYKIEFMDFDEETGHYVNYGILVKADTEASALSQIVTKYPLAWDAQVVGIDEGVKS
jgi:hypothetical protein